MQIMRTAAAQISVEPGNVRENTEKMLSFVEQAAKIGADVVVFPEMSDTGYDMPMIVNRAQTWETGTAPALQEAARRNGLNIVAGVSERTTDGIFNSIIIIDRKGVITERYRKTHLITAEPILEQKFLKAGSRLVTAEVDGVLCGFMTCYDIRFPEVARTLSVRGAQILFIPSAFPLVRLPHWISLVNARAIENQIFVVACNRIGHDAGISFCGTTTIVDPYGTVISSGSDIHESLVTANIDLSMIDTVRSQIKVYQDRQPNLYHVD
jgi:omega-amidase